MSYRKKKARYVQWHEIKDMFRSRFPNSVTQARIRFHGGGKAEITHEIADAIEREYLAKMGTPIRSWDGKSW